MQLASRSGPFRVGGEVDEAVCFCTFGTDMTCERAGAFERPRPGASARRPRGILQESKERKSARKERRNQVDELDTYLLQSVTRRWRSASMHLRRGQQSACTNLQSPADTMPPLHLFVE